MCLGSKKGVFADHINMFIPFWIIVAILIVLWIAAGKAEESESKISELEDRLDEMEGDPSDEDEFNEF